MFHNLGCLLLSAMCRAAVCNGVDGEKLPNSSFQHDLFVCHFEMLASFWNFVTFVMGCLLIHVFGSTQKKVRRSRGTKNSIDSLKQQVLHRHILSFLACEVPLSRRRVQASLNWWRKLQAYQGWELIFEVIFVVVSSALSLLCWCSLCTLCEILPLLGNEKRLQKTEKTRTIFGGLPSLTSSPVPFCALSHGSSLISSSLVFSLLPHPDTNVNPSGKIFKSISISFLIRIRIVLRILPFSLSLMFFSLVFFFCLRFFLCQVSQRTWCSCSLLQLLTSFVVLCPLACLAVLCDLTDRHSHEHKQKYKYKRTPK